MNLSFFIPECILRTLYCTLVLPYINYGILTWGKACKTYLENIHKLQKWAVRIISNSYYRSHSAPLFQTHNILNVYNSYKQELGVFIISTSMGHYLSLLMPSLPNFPTFIIMTQETNQIITQLEIKRSLLTKQLELWDQSYGIHYIKT